MNRIVKIQAGQDCEHVGLQKGYEELKTGQCCDKAKRQPSTPPAETHNESTKHFQQGVAGDHVCKQSDGQADWTDEIGDNLDRHQDHQQEYRDTAGCEQGQKLETVTENTDQCHRNKDRRGKTEGHDDMAGNRKAVGDHAQEVTKQDEHEDGENEREIKPLIIDLSASFQNVNE